MYSKGKYARRENLRISSIEYHKRKVESIVFLHVKMGLLETFFFFYCNYVNGVISLLNCTFSDYSSMMLYVLPPNYNSTN